MSRVLHWVKRSWNWLKWPIALGLLSFLFYRHRDDFAHLQEHALDWPFLSVAFVLCSLSLLLTFFRWYLLVWSQEIPFRLHDAFRLGFIGFLFNYVAPGTVGGDLIKALLIAREQPERRTVAVATVLLDRILGLLALFLVGGLAALLQLSFLQTGELQGIAVSLGVGGLVGFAGLGVMLHPAVPRSRWLNKLVHWPVVGRPIGELINGVLLYQQRRRVVVACILISVVGHWGMLSTFYFCALGLQMGEAAPDYLGHLFLIPAAELAGVISLLPGGLGALEGAIEYVYGLAHEVGESRVSIERAWAAGFLTAIAYRVITIVISAIGAGYYLTLRSEIEEVLEETSEEEAEATPAGSAWASETRASAEEG